MPIAYTTAGTNDLCGKCDLPSENLRKCAKCKLVRYCSPACQKADWKKHKGMCVDHEAELGSMGDSWKPFHRWLDVWSYPLQAWGLLFANLAGHSPDYLATHCLFVHVAFRKEPKADKKLNKNRMCNLLRAQMMSNEDVETYITRTIPEWDPADRDPNTQDLPKKANFMRIVILCDRFTGYFGNPIVALRLDKFALFKLTAVNLDENKIIAREVAANAEKTLRKHMQEGDVDGYKEYVNSIITAHS